MFGFLNCFDCFVMKFPWVICFTLLSYLTSYITFIIFGGELSKVTLICDIPKERFISGNHIFHNLFSNDSKVSILSR